MQSISVTMSLEIINVFSRKYLADSCSVIIIYFPKDSWNMKGTKQIKYVFQRVIND